MPCTHIGEQARINIQYILLSLFPFYYLYKLHDRTNQYFYYFHFINYTIYKTEPITVPFCCLPTPTPPLPRRILPVRGVLPDPAQRDSGTEVRRDLGAVPRLLPAVLVPHVRLQHRHAATADPRGQHGPGGDVVAAFGQLGQRLVQAGHLRQESWPRLQGELGLCGSKHGA